MNNTLSTDNIRNVLIAAFESVEIDKKIILNVLTGIDDLIEVTLEDEEPEITFYNIIDATLAAMDDLSDPKSDTDKALLDQTKNIVKEQLDKYLEYAIREKINEVDLGKSVSMNLKNQLAKIRSRTGFSDSDSDYDSDYDSIPIRRLNII